MKILYVSPENVTGGFSLFAQGHRARGNQCRWITFFRNRFGFEEDICFDLRWMPISPVVRLMRKSALKSRGYSELTDLSGNPPIWKAPNGIAAIFFKLRDMINTTKINRTIGKYGLNDFDIYHFEQGVDPYRDSRWVKELAEQGKGIVCFYHGSDIRNRGIIRQVHEVSRLNLTSEIDLLDRLPGMEYLFLPVDTDQVKPHHPRNDGMIRICHAARNRWFKGSDQIEAVVKNLIKRYPVEWVMIENLPHDKALEIKSDCDIFIDQVTDRGGWGYGASSVESLALGLPTMTFINDKVDQFLGRHPFISATPDTLESELVKLIENPDLRTEYSRIGREWVIRTHGIEAVMDKLYGYYDDNGLI